MELGLVSFESVDTRALLVSRGSASWVTDIALTSCRGQGYTKGQG